MTDDHEESETGQQFPGLSIEEFESAVETLSVLLTRQSIMLFHSPRQGTRIVGDLSAFRTDYEQLLQEKAQPNPKGSEAALEEVADILGFYSKRMDARAAVEAYSQIRYAAVFAGLEKSDQTSFRLFLHDKVLLVSNLFTPAMRNRATRLRSASTSVEGLDFEVITERHDDISGTVHSSPYLRMRLRYWEGEQPDFSAPFSFFMDMFNIPGKDFEIEADEVDIDFLVRRLLHAKKVLQEAVSNRGQEPRAASE